MITGLDDMSRVSLDGAPNRNFHSLDVSNDTRQKAPSRSFHSLNNATSTSKVENKREQRSLVEDGKERERILLDEF